MNKLQASFALSVFKSACLLAIGLLVGYQLAPSESVYRHLIAWGIGGGIGIVLALIASVIYGGWIRPYQLHSLERRSTPRPVLQFPAEAAQPPQRPVIITFPVPSEARRTRRR